MCVYSMVADHFNPIIPDWHPPPWMPNPLNPGGAGSLTITQNFSPFATKADIDALRAEIDALAKVVREFIEAKRAAEIVDRLTGQPDCVDPEKALLEQRVADLERKLAAAREAIGA